MSINCMSYDRVVCMANVLLQEIFDWKGVDHLCEYIKKADQNYSNLSPITQVQAICTVKGQVDSFVVYKDVDGNYGLPGGSVEEGENLEETLRRELKEEAAVTLLRFKPLLINKVTNQDTKEISYQMRYWAEVELLDEPVNDPAGKAVAREVLGKEDMVDKLGWGPKLDLYLREYENTNNP